MKDLYESLGVARAASQEDIKKAYRKLTREFHPDLNPGDKAAEDRFKEISAAYDVLSDKDKRALYDEFGAMSLTEGFDAKRARAYRETKRHYGATGPSGFGADGFFRDASQARTTAFDDLLSQLFGGGRVHTNFDMGGGRPTSRKGADVEGTIGVSFLDALAGVTVPLRIEGQDGNVRSIDVKVPAGMPDGGKLRLKGQGGAGVPPGDVLLTVTVKPHKHLTRDGQNLRMRLPITAYEALAGASIDVPTPHGDVSLKVPAGAQNGQILRLKGRGVRQGGKPDGDLFLELDVRLPATADDALLKALKRLQDNEHPRAELASMMAADSR